MKFWKNNNYEIIFPVKIFGGVYISQEEFEAGGRWAPHPQSKAIGDSFPVDWNSVWALPRPCISHSQSWETSLTTHAQKSSLEVKGELCQGMFYPYTFPVESTLAKRWVNTPGNVLRFTKYGPQTKMIGQRKARRKAPQNNSNGHEHMTEPLSLSEPASVSIHIYCTLFFLLINTLLASLLSVFVGILFSIPEGPRPLSLTTGLVARIWSFHRCDAASISGWEPKLHFRPLQAKATRDQTQGREPHRPLKMSFWLHGQEFWDSG